MENKKDIRKEILDFIIGTSGILLALALIFAVKIYITPPSPRIQVFLRSTRQK